MSTTIDEKVVEMRFDNRHFEANTKETMSTLDKLKQKLNLTGASKGLENINTSANKVNMSGMANAIETVHSKFSALEVMGITALANITNSAVNAGKRIVSALTIDPIKTGFNEYETQINAVQTILANTQKEGTDITKVNAALDELNEYADKTIYNFTEMTRNIGTFTAAGVKLDTSVSAIKGISNLAAVSGSTSQQASTAMYQLSQALASGTVKLMDWNSVVNAGMGGQVFQDALKETARVHGVAIDKMIKDEGSFRETLKDGWLTSEILTETLEKFTYASNEMTDAEKQRITTMLKSKGYNDKQIEGIFKLGNTATEAATKVKTFTQLWDVLKESAQSGWAQTWRILVGDFEEAKSLFTPLADFLTGIINKFSKARNTLLEGALSFNPFSALMDKINKVSKKLNGATKSLEYYQDMVNKVWRGDYKNQPVRSGLLEKEGHNYEVIQSLVNKGYQYKLTVDDITEAEKKHGIATSETAKATVELTDAQLKEIGLTEEEIKLYRELEEQSKKTGKSIDEILKSMENKDGRTLLIESFKNAGQGLVSVFKAIGEAWTNAFPPMSSLQLYNIIAAINKFSTKLVMSEDTFDNLTRTLKGLFAIIDLIAMVAGGGLRIAFTILKTILGAFNMDVLQFTAYIGDAIVKFRDWIENNNLIVIGIRKLIEYIKLAVDGIKNWIANNETITKGIEKFKSKLEEIRNSFSDWIKGLKEADNIPKYILQGLVNGLKNGASLAIDAIITLGKGLLEGIKKVLGIHSPSTEFFEIGKNIVQGLFNGISGFIQMVYSLVMSIGTKLIDIIKNLNLGSIITMATGGGMIYGFVKIANALEAISGPFESLDYTFLQAGKVLKTFRGTLRSFSTKIKAEALKSIAIAIGILAASVAVLALLDTTKVWSSVGAIAALVILLGGLSAFVGKFGGNDGVAFGKMALTILALGVAMGLMAIALKKVSDIDPDRFLTTIGAFAGIIGAMLLLIATMSKLGKLDSGQQMAKIGGTFISLGIALTLMAVVIKIIGGMDQKTLIQGTLAVLAFSGLIIGLMAATKLIGKTNVDHIGKSISKIAGALLMITLVVAIAGKMKPETLLQGTLAVIAFSGIIVGLMAATKLIGGKDLSKLGSTIAGVGAAMLMMAIVVRMVGGMRTTDLIKGTVVIAAFAGIIVGLIAATNLVSGKDLAKVGTTILMISISIGLMAVVAALLSLMDVASLTKGVIAVSILSLIMMGLIAVTKNVPPNITGTMIALTAAIGILALSLGLLSFINTGKLIGASVALSAIIGMFGLVIKMTSTAQKATGTLLILTVAIGVLAGALYLIAQLPAEQALAASASLSLLLGVLSGVMLILGKLGGINAKALLGVLGILALCAPLYLIVDVLSRMQNVSNATTNATTLALFMGALTIVQLLCAASGAIYTATGGVAMLGLVGMLAIIAMLYAVLGALAIMANIPNAISNLTALQTFMIVMAGILVVLAIVGPLALTGVIAMGALIQLMLVVGALAVAIGGLMENFPVLQRFLDAGLPVLIQLAGGIGEMIGAFVGGMIAQISNALPTIGANLSLFMNNAMPFITGAKMIDTKVLAGIGILSGAILALTAASIIEGVTAFLLGGSSFAQLGTELSAFMINAMPFIVLSRQIDPAIMTGIKTLSEAILILTASNILDGLTAWLTGGNSLANFGSQLGDLGTSLSQFVSNIGTFTDAQVTTVDCAGRAIKALAEAAKAIPNDGGLWGSIVGENSISTFGNKLPGLATNIAAFVTNLGTFSDSQVTTVDCAGRAIVSLAQAAKEIPNDGGLWGAIVGENSISTFGNKLPGLGTNLNSFITNLGSFSDAQVTTVDCAGKAIKALAEAASTIPNEGGLWAKIVGDNSLATFGNKLPGLATNIKTFVSNLGTFSESQVTTVNSACNAIRSIAKLGNIDIKNTGDGLKSFGDNMVKFAKKVKEFVDNVGKVGSDGIESAITKTKDLIEMAKTTASANIDSIKTFGESLKKFAKDGVKGFVEEFSGESPKSKAKKATGDMVKAAIDGAEDKKSDVKNKFKDIAKAAADALADSSYKEKAKSAGSDLASGFADGISQSSYKAEAKARAMAAAAVQAAKDELDINSPSKVFRKIGSGVPEGFAQGITMFGSKVKNSVITMSDTAISGTRSAISRIADAINTDMDTQPTIRPVLDLSEVESGAGYLSGMFNNGPSIGVTSNLRAISSGMNGRLQNGTNSEVVSAINKLRKDLGNVKGNTYNVNGVTYDDGSNITEAVEALIRAAKVERRK